MVRNDSGLVNRLNGILIHDYPHFRDKAIKIAIERNWLIPEEPDISSLKALVKRKKYYSEDRVIRPDREYEVTSYLDLGVELTEKLDYNFPLNLIQVSFRFKDKYHDYDEERGVNYESFYQAKKIIDVGDILEMIFSRKAHNDIVLLNVLREIKTKEKIDVGLDICPGAKNYTLGPVYQCADKICFSEDGEGIEIIVLSKDSVGISFKASS